MAAAAHLPLKLGLRVSGAAAHSDPGGGVFPSFLPKQVQYIKDPYARSLAQRIQRLPVPIGVSEACIMSSCVTPAVRREAAAPVVLLHCFDSSCLEWRSVYPLLEGNGLEAWAIDVLGWGFSDLEGRPPCDVPAKRCHLYQLWKSHIRRPMTLVGPSLGAAVAIDFAVNFPEAVDKLVLINPQVYANRTGFTKLPKFMAYAMASLLKSMPVRWYAKVLVFDGISLSKILDWTNVGRLHCLLPWWEDAMVNFMLSGGYNVSDQIKKVKKRTLLICSEHDKIVDIKFAERLQNELLNATMQKLPDCGHMPHIEKPNVVAKLIADFSRRAAAEERTVSFIVNGISYRNKQIHH
ncbi:uncharacterized protein LOC127258335 isoform X2 [Andrographis paniculata]|uniref:uncharacterized protein LOC127258335 isoform X2 n=1 Tax=Andrographis paniculata TaxID=175694 RepID=UPI0021E88A72|nr:uncharacterized protein LOC127258335 isoform X2 [Andrographis paniculata]